ncbi:Mitochondrial ribosome-associated GTPase 2 [Labeo rohita]|uniref:Mitochondrial ribosome-associated GTPase 2 n=1 Tax=Labeo rohita TaxID=84645 RepID=A0ABQ8L0E0_LABRO|nr:Mitochondrial ribosome-associated GTPase 2 [Labeo rohita]
MLFEKHMARLCGRTVCPGLLLLQRAHKHRAARLSEKKLDREGTEPPLSTVSPGKSGAAQTGGNGGAGGDIIIKVDQQVKSLSSVSTVYRGKDGEAGSGKNCFGRNASPTYISVPVGTVVKEEGRTLADLSHHGQLYTAAYGGAGGKGNRFFLSNENRAPLTATPGEKGQERVVQLELRTMAHAALVSARPVSKITHSLSCPSKPSCSLFFCATQKKIF